VLSDRPPSAASAAEVIEQTRNDATRRGGRELILPPQPGDDTVLIVDRPSAKSDTAADLTALTGLRLDVIFPVLHGPYGEDGTIQGLLELAGVPYVGCGVLASAVGMDKGVMKTLFRARGLPTPDWITVNKRDWLAERTAITRRISQKLGYPAFVKPANLGSSVGISKVKKEKELADAVNLAAEFDLKVIVEAAVPSAREIECGVLGNGQPEASVPGEIVPAGEFYDYDAKYVSSGSRLEIPADLAADVAAEVRRLSIEAFAAIEGSGLARVDFLLNRETGDLFLNEINTLPGFTTISMYSKLWAASGVDYPTLVDRLVTLALERHAERRTLRTSMF
jgi:D-alanine-D-alanine ligase